MRIAYVSLHWPRTTTSGVGKKINQQISYWQNFGNDVRLFMHTYDYQPVSELLNGSMFRYRRIPGFAGKLVTEIFRILAANKMLRGIREYNPDIIYLRMGMYTFPLHHICKLAPLVSEINTNDVKQHRLLGKALSTYNQLTRSILLTRSRGLVFVSSELY